jgi:hypothetical protein
MATNRSGIAVAGLETSLKTVRKLIDAQWIVKI